MKVSLHRLPRSGSTVAKRVMRTVADLVWASHDVFQPTAQLVMTQRNPLDIAASHWRILGAVAKAEAVQGVAHVTLRRIEQWQRMYTPEAWIWRYENMRTPEQVANWCEAHGIRCPVQDIADIVDPQKAIQVQSRVEIADPNYPFGSYDDDTGIHANHIGPHRGEPEQWRVIIPPEYHEKLLAALDTTCKQWGYPCI